MRTINNDNGGPITTSAPIKKRAARPMPDMTKKFALWSEKYECTFFGDTREDCIRQLTDLDKKRFGQRMPNGSKNFTVTEKSGG